MDVLTRSEGSVLVVKVNGDRIDASAAIGFKEAVRTASADGDGAVLLDLTDVQFIDSSGLGAIVASMKALGKERTMVLAGLTENVAKVFKLTRMDSVFAVFATIEAALLAYAPTEQAKAAI